MRGLIDFDYILCNSSVNSLRALTDLRNFVIGHKEGKWRRFDSGIFLCQKKGTAPKPRLMNHSPFPIYIDDGYYGISRAVTPAPYSSFSRLAKLLRSRNAGFPPPSHSRIGAPSFPEPFEPALSLYLPIKKSGLARGCEGEPLTTKITLSTTKRGIISPF